MQAVALAAMMATESLGFTKNLLGLELNRNGL
jgi:hypothetical protein